MIESSITVTLLLHFLSSFYFFHLILTKLHFCLLIKDIRGCVKHTHVCVCVCVCECVCECVCVECVCECESVCGIVCVSVRVYAECV